jgi:hypothetical protein
MRRGLAIVLAVVVVLMLVGVGAGAYHAGVDEGIRRAATSGQVVEVVGGGYGWHGGGFGFFPFGLILFPLFLFGMFALIGGAFRRGPWGGPGRRGPWMSEHGRSEFEARANDWHARQHAQGSTSPDPGGGATTA